MNQKKSDSAKNKKLTPEEARAAAIRQESSYREGNKPEPDNNLFFENHSNPLSSKGN